MKIYICFLVYIYKYNIYVHTYVKHVYVYGAFHEWQSLQVQNASAYARARDFQHKVYVSYTIIGVSKLRKLEYEAYEKAIPNQARYQQMWNDLNTIK